MKRKEIIKTVRGYNTKDGAGVSLIRVIGDRDVNEADPFLMLDAFDSDDPNDYIKGFPMHPHRGIETVTYLIAGQIDHQDSLGNKGTIRSGESQWMTAGSGILHQEMPQRSERLFGLQLWVNLPKNDKMTAPQYADITNDMIKTIDTERDNVRVIAGDFEHVSGFQSKHVKVLMLDISLKGGSSIAVPLADEATVIVYMIEGEANFDGHIVKQRTAAIFGGKGDTIFAEAKNDHARFVLFAGNPLKEPISWGGPVVMNTRAELETAFKEIQNGTFIKKGENNVKVP